MPENTTPNRGYQLPHPDNAVAADVYRIVSAIEAIDLDVAALLTSLAGKAATVHGHAIGEVAGLTAALDGKASTTHTHTLDDLSDVSGTADAPIGNILARISTGWVAATPAALGLAGATMQSFSETVASGPKSTFTIPGGYVVGGVVVVANGVVLDPSEFTATNGTSITVGTALATGDVFYAITFPSVTIGVPAAKTVTNAILADMPTGRIKGRFSAGDGDAQDLTAAQVKSILGIGIGDVSGLTSTLSGKSDVGHTHPAGAITGLAAAVAFTQTYTSAEQAIVQGGAVTLSHGLGVVPKATEFRLVCKEADGDFTAGQEIPANLNSSTQGSTRVTKVVLSSTQVLVRYANDGAVFVSNDTGGNVQFLNNTKWRLVVRAYA